MGLKLKVENLDDVEEGVRSLYKEVEGGGFVLEVDDLEDTGALKRAKDHEVEEHRKTKEKLQKLEKERRDAADKARKAEEDAARASGSVEELDKSWQKKHTDAIAELRGQYDPLVQSQDADIRRLLVDNVSRDIAIEIAVDEDAVAALLPHIKGRLGVDIRDGQRVTVVVDANGKASALTLDELKKELKTSKTFARLIKGSKASGGGAGGGSGGGAPPTDDLKRSKMSPKEKSEYITNHGREAYEKLPWE